MRNFRVAITMGLALAFIIASITSQGQQVPADTSYLSDIKKEMKEMWPESRTINLVFHGHSVPAGYWTNHEVQTLQSYPNILLKKLKQKYPYAVINIIVTAIGGENSIKGQTRMGKVLAHEPDVLFIDYALNDRFAGLEKSKEAWEKMIQSALKNNIKVILLTPSPDQRVNILEAGNALELHASQIRELAMEYHIALADPFSHFKKIAAENSKVADYMSHVNHPNEKGHTIIADEIMKWF